MCERRESLLDNRHHLWLAEPDHEKSRLVEQVDRSTCQGRTLNGRPVLGEGRVRLWPRGAGAASA